MSRHTYLRLTFPVLLSSCRGRQLCTWPPQLQPWHWPWLAYSASMLRHFTFDNRYHEPPPTVPARGRFSDATRQPEWANASQKLHQPLTLVPFNHCFISKNRNVFYQLDRWYFPQGPVVHSWHAAAKQIATTDTINWKMSVPCTSVNIPHDHKYVCKWKALTTKLVSHAGY